jgi:hypothetical protein
MWSFDTKHICLGSFLILTSYDINKYLTETKTQKTNTYEHVGKHEQQQHRFRWMDGVTAIQNQKQPFCFIFLLSSDLCHLRRPSSWSILYICWSSSNCHPRNPWSSLFSGNFYWAFLANSLDNNTASDFMHNHLYYKRLCLIKLVM